MIHYLRWNDCYLQPLSRFGAQAAWLKKIGSGRHQVAVLSFRLSQLRPDLAKLLIDASILKPLILTFGRDDRTVASLDQVREQAAGWLKEIALQKTLQGTFLGIDYLTIGTARGCFRPRLEPQGLKELRDVLFRGKIAVVAPPENVREEITAFNLRLARELKGYLAAF